MRSMAVTPIWGMVILLLVGAWHPTQQNAPGIVGQVTPSDTPVQVFRIPDASIPPDIQLNGGTFVTIIGRTQSNDWMNIQVPGSVRGWLPTDNLTILDPTFDHNQLPVTPMDANTILQYSLLWNFETPRNLITFQRGRERGNVMNGFALVGDSITASSMYLTPLSDGIYDLQAYPHLQHVLDYFGTTQDSPFGQNSMAVRNGWSTRDVLSPQRALQRGCPSGTTPLTCEYQRVSPAFALIMLGTNDVVVMGVDEFKSNLQTIIETTLSYDIVPILFTAPPHLSNTYNEHPFNQAIIQISQEYDLAVINYWLAVQTLPNKGMSADLVHPSGPPSNAGTTLFTPDYLQYGFTMRNLVTLQGLDLLLKHTVYPAFG